MVTGSNVAGRPVRTLAHPLLAGIVGATLATAALVSYHGSADGIVAAFMLVVLTVVATTDLERRIIPNRIILPATLMLLCARVALHPGRAGVFVAAGLAAGLAFMAINLLSGPAMGMGDVKLVAFLGVGLGSGVIGAVVIAFLALFPFALGTLAREGLRARKKSLPFGPFLAFGAAVILIVPHLIGAAAG